MFRVYGSNRMEEMIAIPEVMFQPDRLRRQPFFDEILSTLTTEPIQEVDNNLPEAVSYFFFNKTFFCYKKNKNKNHAYFSLIQCFDSNLSNNLDIPLVRLTVYFKNNSDLIFSRKYLKQIKFCIVNYSITTFARHKIKTILNYFTL